MINGSRDFNSCGYRTEIRVSFPLKILSVFPLSLQMLAATRWQNQRRQICGYSIPCLYFHRQYHCSAGYVPDIPGLPCCSKEDFLMESMRRDAVQIMTESTQRLLVVYGMTKKALIQAKWANVCVYNMISHKRMDCKCISLGHFRYLDLNMAAASTARAGRGVWHLSSDSAQMVLLFCKCGKPVFSRGVI